MRYKYHDLANIFPMMSPDEALALRSDITQNGLIEKIILLDGKILDGRNRYEACLAVGVCPKFETFDGDNPLDFVISKNLQRRHLTTSQRACIALEVVKNVSAKAEANGKQGRSLSVNDCGIDSNQVAATALGVGRTTVATAKFIEENDPSLIPKILNGDLTISKANKQVRLAQREKPPVPRLVLGLTPTLICGDILTAPIEPESVDIIITSPPYNLGGSNEEWPMGGDGRETWMGGVDYDITDDDRPEATYQVWQISCLKAIYNAAKPGASLFYNHKVRHRNGQIIHPMDWLRLPDNPWTIRQEIIWNRTSTHNHTPSLFWQIDERIYWMVKGDTPTLPNRPIGFPSVIELFGPVANTWHPAPFTPELPTTLLKAIGFDGCVVLDPFAGSCATGVAATNLGYKSIMVDISESYLKQAANVNGWLY